MNKHSMYHFEGDSQDPKGNSMDATENKAMCDQYLTSRIKTTNLREREHATMTMSEPYRNRNWV